MCDTVNGSPIPRPLPQNGRRLLEDGRGNCVHIPGAVMSHSQNLECPIRSLEIRTLHNNDCSTLTNVTEVKCHVLQLHTYDANTRETHHMIWHVILMSMRQENGRSFQTIF